MGKLVTDNRYKWYVIYEDGDQYTRRKTLIKEYDCIGEAQMKAESLLKDRFGVQNVTVAQAKFFYERKVEIDKTIL